MLLHDCANGLANQCRICHPDGMRDQFLADAAQVAQGMSFRLIIGFLPALHQPNRHDHPQYTHGVGDGVTNDWLRQHDFV